MKKERRVAAVTVTFGVVLLASSILAQQKPKDTAETDVAVIVNPTNPIDSISLADLRKIFSGEKLSWAHGLQVNVFIRVGQAHEREVLLSQILRMSESEYKAHWVRKVYSGEAQREPLALPSNGMQLEAIRAEKGGIALISMQDIHPGVKVLKVERHMPGTPGYPLK